MPLVSRDRYTEWVTEDDREHHPRTAERPVNGVKRRPDLSADDPPLGVILPIAPNHSVAKEWALVLTSQGLKSRIEQTRSGFRLVVHPDHTQRAVEILATWRAENVPRAIPTDLQATAKSNPVDYAIAFALVVALFAFHLHLERTTGSQTYYDVGRASSYQIMHGEFWRTLTALTLHAGLAHALGNTLIGGFFLASLAGRIGAGFALAGAVLTGALGNFVNAIYHQTAHSSIGASTAVFGVVGLLCGFEAWRRNRLTIPWRGAWVPLGAGIALLAMLGTGSAKTDLAAHIFGLLSGMTLGFAAAPPFRARRPGVGKQLVAGGTSLLLILGSWMIALRSAAD
jgi:rhomboid protease GluP